MNQLAAIAGLKRGSFASPINYIGSDFTKHFIAFFATNSESESLMFSGILFHNRPRLS